MIVVTRVELDGKEIEHLREIVKIDCSNVKGCSNCPLNMLVQDDNYVCLKSLARICVSRNTIVSMKGAENEQNN